MNYRQIESKDNQRLAQIIRDNLKAHQLDIPGTVYFDDNLNYLSDFYLADPTKRDYIVMVDDKDDVIGGIGLAELDFMEQTAELQKLYIKSDYQGKGLSYELVSKIEARARQLGYKRMYLETHTNLSTAIHVYERTGYKLIDKPSAVVHSSMNRFYLKEL